MKAIVLTGGGTAGHVTPNLALIEALQMEDWAIAYIGSNEGVEKQIIEQQTNIPFYAIRSGKLRRYFSWQNFIDPLNVVAGIWQSFFILRGLKTKVVFSKGGFVALPVVIAAWLNRIPIVTHESDITPGLANQLSFPFVKNICVTFAAAKKHFKKAEKVRVTGTPIRQNLFQGNAQKGIELCGFNSQKPCLLVIGGSLGAQSINQVVRKALPKICQQYQVIHICGKGKMDAQFAHHAGYKQFEYVNEELAHLFAASSLVISRAGSNALYEILALQKPHILIPLSRKVSRGDQIQNAAFFAEQGISTVLQEDALSADSLCGAINEVTNKKDTILHDLQLLNIGSATQQVLEVIKESLSDKSSSIIHGSR